MFCEFQGWKKSIFLSITVFRGLNLTKHCNAKKQTFHSPEHCNAQKIPKLNLGGIFEMF